MTPRQWTKRNRPISPGGYASGGNLAKKNPSRLSGRSYRPLCHCDDAATNQSLLAKKLQEGKARPSCPLQTIASWFHPLSIGALPDRHKQGTRDCFHLIPIIARPNLIHKLNLTCFPILVGLSNLHWHVSTICSGGLHPKRFSAFRTGRRKALVLGDSTTRYRWLPVRCDSRVFPSVPRTFRRAQRRPGCPEVYLPFSNASCAASAASVAR